MRSGILGPRGRWLLIVLGVVLLGVAFYLGAFDYSKMRLEKLLGILFRFDPAVTSSPAYAFERWLVIAVLMTVFLNVIYYLLNLKTMSRILREAGTQSSSFWDWFIQLFPAVAILIGCVFPFLCVITYANEPGHIGELKKATAVLLFLFVFYDFLLIALGKLLPTPTSEEASREAIFSLIRIDVPILVAYGLLLIYSSYMDLGVLAHTIEQWAKTLGVASTMTEGHANFYLTAFGAGAGAFKLLISNLLFTFLMFEMIIFDLDRAAPAVTDNRTEVENATGTRTTPKKEGE